MLVIWYSVTMYFKIASLIGIGIIALLLWWVYSQPNSVTNYPSSRVTVVAFGDSLVSGVGSTDGQDFVSALSTQVGVPILNEGVAGNTTADALARVDDILALNPKVVLVLFGGNDALQQVPASETFANLGVLIETIHESGAMVVLLGVRGGLLRDEYGSQFEDLARTYNTAFVPDVLTGVFGRPALMSDPIHPNDAGYLIIANRVAPVLQPLLE